MSKVSEIFKLLYGLAILGCDSLLSAIGKARHLPAPDGKYKVGTFRFNIVDDNRHGILASESEARRLTVRVWYPTGVTGAEPYAKFMENTEMTRLFSSSMKMPKFMFKKLSKTVTNSAVRPPFAADLQYADVLIFSHGHGSFEGQNVLQMEHLASHGYAVFSICHTYEAFATYFSDDDIVPKNARATEIFTNELLNSLKEYNRKTDTPEAMRHMVTSCPTANQNIDIRVGDIIFTLDQLEKINRGEMKSPLEGKLKLDKIGVFGHSFGGAAAGDVTLSDDRFCCFINMDGAPFGRLPNNITNKPFMILNNEASLIVSGYHPDQSNFISIKVKGTKHLDFTDLPLALPAMKRSGLGLGAIDGIRQMKIVNDYILAFFDTFIRNRPNTLITNGDARYEEVTVKNRLGSDY